ncbi:uncharacterized protein LOC142355939 [Convolutriloba macropyga]|uniref:uncharacterized protein LOC142355939 n=1 Tax=Convolutriloba macropyga TaxID=536237 RepID=UPI003F51D60E
MFTEGVLKRVSVKLANKQDVEESTLVQLQRFVRKLSKTKRLHEEIVNAKRVQNECLTHYCLLKDNLCKIIKIDSKPDTAKAVLQIFLDLVYCEMKLSTNVAVFDSLVKESFSSLVMCLFMDGPKSSTNSFLQLCNKRHDYIVCIIFVMASTIFTETVLSLNQACVYHLIKCILKINFYSAMDDSNDSTEHGKKKLSAKISKLWLTVLSRDLNLKSSLLVLTNMCDKIMPILFDCRDLTDFLMQSVTAESIKKKFLALECFYLLLVKYNIEYPGIYDRIICMCGDNAFQLSTYSLTFLDIIRKFLMSSKLSIDLVKNFVLILGKVSFKCETDVLISILNLMRDVVLQHKLVTGPQGELTREEFTDVYLIVEDSMKSHFNPVVRKAATNLLRELDDSITGSENVNFDIDEIMQKLCLKTIEKSGIAIK